MNEKEVANEVFQPTAIDDGSEFKDYEYEQEINEVPLEV